MRLVRVSLDSRYRSYVTEVWEHLRQQMSEKEGTETCSEAVAKTQIETVIKYITMLTAYSQKAHEHCTKDMLSKSH